MIQELRQLFESRFGRAPNHAARAPGRVNLMGGATDYNEGLVLPIAIDRDTVVLAAARKDSRFRVHSRERDALASFDVANPARVGDWIDYVQGVVVALRDGGARVPGFDLVVGSEVPLEAGLSSSAALSVAVTTVLDAALGLGLDPARRAGVAHRAESKFVGVGCGVMDQFASVFGQRDCALRIDCRSLEIRPVRLPTARLRILVADSGVRRKLSPEADVGYGERRAQCEAALETARAAGIGPAASRALRDLGPENLPALERALPPVLFRRARHVIRENQRVDAVCAALASGDLVATGALFLEAMASLRDDFVVSTPEIDVLCELADACPGVFASRLTGAGFGGCTLHLVEPDAEERAVAAIGAGFERRFGRRPRIFPVVASEGAGVLRL